MERAAEGQAGPAGTGEVFRIFLRLGLTAFGGPAAHIGIMRQEFVQRRRWVDDDEFLRLLAAVNVVPGPNSTEMAIHLGRERAAWRGFAVAGIGFILPAAVLVLAFAWLYANFGTRAEAEWLLYGVKPVVVAIIAWATIAFGRTVLKKRHLAPVLAGALALAVAGLPEIGVLLAGAAAGPFAARVVPRPPARAVAFLPLLSTDGGRLTELFLTFLRIGSLLFGSGYVLLAFVQDEFVDRLGWLTEQQVLDAVAIGQVTPGPLFSTATFIGYVTAGWGGAVVATVAIFLPAFVFVALSRPALEWVRRSAIATAALDGIVAASVALLVVVLWTLADAAFVDWPAVVATAAGLAVLWRWPALNSAWLVLGGVGFGLASVVWR